MSIFWLCEKEDINHMKTFGKVMAVIAILLVIIFAKGIGKMAGKYAVDNYNQGELEGAIEKKLLETSKQINAQLPIMVDKETRADITMCSGKHLIYKYTMVSLSEKDIDKIAFKNEIKSMLVKNQCSNEDMVKMLKLGIQYDYIYHDRDGNLLATGNVSKTDCGF
jgi:sensor c-di-GMP phosphodiesterase-like protein